MDSTFYIKYASGCMQLNIGEFFGTQDLRKIRKTLQLASLHCSPEQRETLLSEMRRANQIRKDAVDGIAALELKKMELLAPFFKNGLAKQASAAELQLVKQCNRILKSIAILEEVWQV